MDPDAAAQAYRLRWRQRQAAQLARARLLVGSPAARQTLIQNWRPWLWPDRALPIGDESNERETGTPSVNG